MFTFPILRTLILDVKQTVKHIVRIDNDIRIHILMYSLIVIGHDAYVEHGTASQPHHFTPCVSLNLLIIKRYFN